MKKEIFEPTPENIRAAIKREQDHKSNNLEAMRSLADENDRIDRRVKRLQKQLNDIVYPPHK